MGSIMKPLSLSAGIDAGAITRETTYDDKGFIIKSGKRISNFDGKGRGVVSMQEVLNQSLNTGASFVVDKMGKEKFSEYMHAYGMGEETGIASRFLRVETNFRVTDKYIYQREGQKIFKIVIFFLAQTSNSEVKVSFEHEGYGWFTYREALRHVSHKNIKLILKRANDYLRRKSLPNRP